ncbi:unannotated protein [freshwater metagenome]|uniref:Unannotated protein n=1 Tax=freshwater metagenome TaxID=449393 RepID=A0A6J7SJ99_9ZZZZ
MNLLSVFPSDLIRRILTQFVLAKLHVSSIKGEVAADQRITKADNQLDGLYCLDAADDSREDSEHACLGATRGHFWWWGLGQHIAVSRPVLGIKYSHLALKAEDRSVHNGNAKFHRSVVEHVAHREVVSPVYDDVVLRDDAFHIRSIKANIVRNHVDIWVEQGEGLFCRINLSLTYSICVVQNLALQIRLIDHVHVDNADGANTGSS